MNKYAYLIIGFIGGAVMFGSIYAHAAMTVEAFPDPPEPTPIVTPAPEPSEPISSNEDETSSNPVETNNPEPVNQPTDNVPNPTPTSSTCSV